MYTPKQFKETDQETILEAIRTIQLGAVILFTQERFICAHIPLLVIREGDNVTLEGHVSRANELWQYATNDARVLVIFQGPHTYIRPGWYETKQTTGKVVPTWNYLVIHCHGIVEKEESSQWIMDHLQRLTIANESHQEKPWTISDAPNDFISDLSSAIIGLKIKVADLEGVWKMNQHHSKENRLGVIKGLSSSFKPQNLEVAKIMSELEVKREQ